LDSNRVYIVLKECTGMSHYVTEENIVGVYTSKEFALKVKSDFEDIYRENIIIVESKIEQSKEIVVDLVYKIKMDRDWYVSVVNSYISDSMDITATDKVLFDISSDGCINAAIKIHFDSATSSYQQEEKKATNIVLREAEKLIKDLKKLILKTNIRVNSHMNKDKLNPVCLEFLQNVNMPQESVNIYKKVLEAFGRSMERYLVDIEDKYRYNLMTPDMINQVNQEINNKMSRFPWYDRNSGSLRNGIVEFLRYGNHIFDEKVYKKKLF